MSKFFIIIFCIISIFLVGCGNSGKKRELSVSDINPQANQVSTVSVVKKEDSSIVIKKAIPKGFKVINVLDKVIYVPNEFKKMNVPLQSPNAGMALVGDVLRGSDASSDPLADDYSIAVIYEKQSILHNMKPHEEDETLNLIFKNVFDNAQKSGLQNPKVPMKHELVSKEICRNVDGRKYLKAKSIIRHLNKPKVDENESMAVYIIDDTLYMISVSGLLRANGKYDKEFDTILDTFGCDLK